jgi:hypothetical protein
VRPLYNKTLEEAVLGFTLEFSYLRLLCDEEKVPVWALVLMTPCLLLRAGDEKF